MVKKLPTKSDLRAQLEQQTTSYLDRGGEVSEVPRGTSGTDPLHPTRAFQGSGLFTEPRSKRTFVPEVVAAIEGRRKDRLKSRAVQKRTRLPQLRRKVLYDDFGEPIRKVWVDE
jgi:hypothetical protein